MFEIGGHTQQQGDSVFTQSETSSARSDGSVRRGLSGSAVAGRLNVGRRGGRAAVLVATLLLMGTGEPVRAVSSEPSAAATWRVAWANAVGGGVAVSQWTAHPTSDSALSPMDATYRLVTRPTLSGEAVRIRLTNGGSSPLHVAAATIAARAGRDGVDVRRGTLRRLRFGGSAAAVISPGTSLRSDPVRLPVRALQDLLVSLHVPNSTPQSVHAQTYVPQYVTPPGAGDRTTDLTSAAFTTQQEPMPWLDAVEVRSSAPRTIVAIGDSITDGDQAFPPFNDDAMMDRYERWPDVVARRLATDPSLRGAGIVNQGLNGDTAGGVLARLDRDVLDLAGVTDVVVAVGTNDLTGGRTAPQLIGDLTRIAQRLRARGLRVIGGTLVPRGRALADPDKAVVNDFIRRSGTFDHVLDLERVLGRADAPDAMRPSYDSGDNLHPSPTGYDAIGQAFPVDILRAKGHGAASTTRATTWIGPTDPRLQYEGRWDVRPAAATTVNSGSHVTLSFFGTGGSARFDRRGISDPAEIYVFVDGEQSERVVVDRDVVRLTRRGLRPGRHTLVLAVKDVQEASNRWQPPLASALRLTGMYLDVDTVLEEPPPPAARRFTFLGDSITQGVNLHCATTASECADGTLAYPWQVAHAFGADHEQVGFGAQGVTRGGRGEVPRAQDTVALNYAGSPARSFDAQVVVINQTTNDIAASPAEVTAGYIALLRNVRARYPNATIIALEPFGLGGAVIGTGPAIASAVATTGDRRTHYVRTRGWLNPSGFTEGLHPNASGHRDAARRLTSTITEFTGLRPLAAR